jgi:hypothetical protein
LKDSVFVVRAFVKLRELAMAHKDIGQKLSEIERKLAGHDQAIAGLIDAIRELMAPPVTKRKRPIGFAPWHRRACERRTPARRRRGSGAKNLQSTTSALRDCLAPPAMTDQVFSNAHPQLAMCL